MNPQVFECVKNTTKKFKLGAEALGIIIPGYLIASLIARVFPNTANIVLGGSYAEEHYPTTHGKCHNLFRKLRMDYDEAFQTADVLVMPTTPWVAKGLLSGEAKPLAHFSEANGLISQWSYPYKCGSKSIVITDEE
ncbi:hypothetical protein Clacol_007696 [Clathrus columnatus]|uniref:Uncharacterized protein n=1 Tax=Clathrus columnatus TaxID=1419009 RepID=A0AAV5AFM6_9AGAM|nr:hypothetical protein Clacol_007696 [Clathrus columnatus]